MFFTFNELISQEIKSEDFECKKGGKQALIDFSKGIYFYQNYIGLSGVSTFDVTIFMSL
jgi:hypothetical protein